MTFDKVNIRGSLVIKYSCQMRDLTSFLIFTLSACIVCGSI